MAKYRPYNIRHLGGFFDTRGQPDEVGLANFTLLLNTSIRSRTKRCRRGGWKRLFDGVNEFYNNEDLHDQLLGLQFYYSELSEIITTQQEVGYQYPYFIPARTDPDTQDITDYGLQLGYWPDLLNQGYDWLGNANGGFAMLNDQVGYPYVPCVGELPYQPGFPCRGSTVWSYWVDIIAGQSYPGYSYGDGIPVIKPPRSYEYTYCDTYPYVRDGCGESVTMLNSIGMFDGSRVLVAATKSRIYALNFQTGNWRIVADGLGTFISQERCPPCSQERWMSATVENVMVLTNGVNIPLAFNPIDSPTTCDLWRATPLEDFDTLNILSAGVVGSWKGFIFFGDLVQDGVRFRNRILWSDFNDPYTYIPADDNIAGTQDLGNDETILRIEPLNDFCFVYTDRSIYRIALVASDPTQPTFSFEEIYRGPESLKYKYAFVNTGQAHIYWSENRMLQMESFDKRPVEPDWWRAFSNTIFDGMANEEIVFSGLNEEMCQHFIGGYNPEFKEVWFSWPTGENTCPNMSAVFNLTRGEEGIDLVDQGFTAFHWYAGRRQTALFEWLEQMQVCAREDTLSGFVKEGMPYKLTSDFFDAPVAVLWNDANDWDASPDSDSLCNAMELMWLDVVCSDCDTESRYVMAHADDQTLKEYADRTYSRQELDGSLYVLNGYDTVIRSGQEDFKTDAEKRVNELYVQFFAELQTTPNLLYGYLGLSPSPDCQRWKQLRWYDDCSTIMEGIPLACPTDKTDDEHDEDQTYANDPTHWPTLLRSRYFAYKLKIEGTGGGVCFSKVKLGVEMVENK